MAMSMPSTNHMMNTKEPWRDAIDRIKKCEICVVYENSTNTWEPTGRINHGQGDEPCECNIWGFEYTPLQAVLLADKEKTLTSEEIAEVYIQWKTIEKDIESDAK